MIIRKALIGLAAAGMVFGSTAATAAPVAMDNVRADATVGQSEEFTSFGWVVAILILIGTIGVIMADDDEDPISV
jgi:hypothetical protein